MIVKNHFEKKYKKNNAIDLKNYDYTISSITHSMGMPLQFGHHRKKRVAIMPSLWLKQPCSRLNPLPPIA